MGALTMIDFFWSSRTKRRHDVPQARPLAATLAALVLPLCAVGCGDDSSSTGDTMTANASATATATNTTSGSGGDSSSTTSGETTAGTSTTDATATDVTATSTSTTTTGDETSSSSTTGAPIDPRYETLVTYAPRVWLDEEEVYFPSSVEFAFPHMTRFADGNGDHWIRSTDPLESASDTLPFFAGDLDGAPVYAFYSDVAS